MISILGVLLGLVILGDGAGAIYANRPLTLSPASPVTSQNGLVAIPANAVNAGNLHRFSYETADGATVRFLVIHKGSGVFGVGLDACDFCGAAGYRQDGKNVICNRCDAAINIATVGFPGGCNPIPVAYRQEGDFIIVPVESFEAAKGIFSQ